MDLLFILVIFALFALPAILVSRANRKRLAEAQALQASAKPGDKVVTVSGFHGVIVGGTEGTVDVELAPGTVVTMERAGVMKIVNNQPAADEVAPADPESAAREDFRE